MFDVNTRSDHCLCRSHYLLLSFHLQGLCGILSQLLNIFLVVLGRLNNLLRNHADSLYESLQVLHHVLLLGLLISCRCCCRLLCRLSRNALFDFNFFVFLIFRSFCSICNLFIFGIFCCFRSFFFCLLFLCCFLLLSLSEVWISLNLRFLLFVLILSLFRFLSASVLLTFLFVFRLSLCCIFEIAL